MVEKPSMVTSVAASRSRKKPVPEVVLKQGVKMESQTCCALEENRSDTKNKTMENRSKLRCMVGGFGRWLDDVAKERNASAFQPQVGPGFPASGC
jgi:hypothetical protein